VKEGSCLIRLWRRWVGGYRGCRRGGGGGVVVVVVVVIVMEELVVVVVLVGEWSPAMDEISSPLFFPSTPLLLPLPSPPPPIETLYREGGT